MRAALAARERTQRLVHQPVGDADRGRDLGSLGLGGIPAGGVQGRLRLLVAAHGAVTDHRVVAAHLRLGLPQPAYDGVQPARREDPVPREHLGVARARVLRQIADVAGGGDRPTRGQRLAGQDPGQRGLPRAVAADEPYPVAGGDPERDVVHQQARAGAHLELGDSDHDRLSTGEFVGDGFGDRLMGRVRRGTSGSGGG
jgi:hypothetical protein